MPKPKRILYTQLLDFDFNNGTSLIRELEMTVDQEITTPGYVPQFWRDVELYGVDEAILYVKNGSYGNHEKISAFWLKLRTEHNL